ncbi:SMI1/KNR4 family protein [Streptomyces liangshanensis]|uniref:SMI1/KNR4 family protein n=1 Tax=Streptomyces liangshanensis TaxID=2717324 RepID=A0A6G9GWR6_9ACTN|nr:SMI1/KNR4 family protein [Streptomyces liangshanensis]QIQ02506.1 SMI1/KNR4 family protein [Streptomyces liangshanensis]
MTRTAFDWRPFLVRWSEEWADACEPGKLYEEDQRAKDTRWLGFAPASAARIGALEERLGRRLPPSYRTFLEVSDGWRHAGGFIELLAGTEAARWFEDEGGFGAWYREDLREDSTPEEVLFAGMWERALQLDVESDLTYVLLDPLDVDADGEWAVHCYRSWAGDMPVRYASFREFMEAMHREFHQLRAGESRTGREFANATTREWDAAVEEGRRAALRGEHAAAERAFARAESYGRPWAKALGDQIRWLCGNTYLADFGELRADPVYAPDVLAVLADEHVRNGHGDGVWSYHFRSASDEVRATGDALLREVREGSFRYRAPGPFGEAVDVAREQARRGDTDAAWRTLLTALPRWSPPGPDLLAPIGLLADRILGPVLTPERGRELLATPRGSAATAGPGAASR